MPNHLATLCCAALLWTGYAGALELQVAIPRPSQQIPSGDSSLKSARVTWLADFNLSLAREICRRLSAKCIFSHPEFSEIIPGIESRRFQLGFGSFLRTPEREARVAFSDTLWRSSSRLLAQPDVAARFVLAPGAEVKLETLHEARVVAISGSRQFEHLQSIAMPQGLKILVRPTIGDCLDALFKEQADFALLPGLYAYILLDPSAEQPLAFVGPGMVEHGLGGTVHIALPRDNENLRRLVNGALSEMRRDGSYQRIWRQYFPFDYS